MSLFSNKRKLSGTRLTTKFHVRYIGVWFVISVALVVLLNVSLHFYVDQHPLSSTASPSDELFPEASLVPSERWLKMMVQTLSITVCLAALGIFTAHRVAGPYVALRKAFDAVKSGDMDHRLRFRTYDNLDEVSDAFNGMMDKLQSSKLEFHKESSLDGPSKDQHRASGHDSLVAPV